VVWSKTEGVKAIALQGISTIIAAEMLTKEEA
jgi:hypothetical protein